MMKLFEMLCCPFSLLERDSQLSTVQGELEQLQKKQEDLVSG